MVIVFEAFSSNENREYQKILPLNWDSDVQARISRIFLEPVYTSPFPRLHPIFRLSLFSTSSARSRFSTVFYDSTTTISFATLWYCKSKKHTNDLRESDWSGDIWHLITIVEKYNLGIRTWLGTQAVAQSLIYSPWTWPGRSSSSIRIMRSRRSIQTRRSVYQWLFEIFAPFFSETPRYFWFSEIQKSTKIRTIQARLFKSTDLGDICATHDVEVGKQEFSLKLTNNYSDIMGLN